MPPKKSKAKSAVKGTSPHPKGTSPRPKGTGRSGTPAGKGKLKAKPQQADITTPLDDGCTCACTILKAPVTYGCALAYQHVLSPPFSRARAVSLSTPHAIAPFCVVTARVCADSSADLNLRADAWQQRARAAEQRLAAAARLGHGIICFMETEGIASPIDLFRMWHSSTEDDLLWKEEFRQACQELKLDGSSDAGVEALFEELDANHCGYVDLKALVFVLKALTGIATRLLPAPLAWAPSPEQRRDSVSGESPLQRMSTAPANNELLESMHACARAAARAMQAALALESTEADLIAVLALEIADSEQVQVQVVSKL